MIRIYFHVIESFYLLFTIKYMLINGKWQAASILATIKQVESDLMSLAQRQTGIQLPVESVFFPPYYNYRLDLIKSFCDIS